jgi:hypothetical protein
VDADRFSNRRLESAVIAAACCCEGEPNRFWGWKVSANFGVGGALNNKLGNKTYASFNNMNHSEFSLGRHNQKQYF